ncbi:metallophosphoesterase family protein [Picrophilus oshimae]|uniref:Serine/threonine protein phosphatase n=1 Tax=Picrophilus torridus (strain ATCC 700027 / DSM 9790 / JCM 10055 / NBRC 100828 / KAW 2/3) TaxID=1122961 RepID=Q6L025_PICTO|nr:metallophosphoesterase family protein [Picrophilus oshimae]AAT43677.1 serine/threonine protein phosphatase [Picrophilus oshimae DSM 9789]
MKILIISDIHGNYDALSSINESYDKMIFLGDAVDYGPEPDRVMDFLRENSDINIMGNHDNAVAYNQDCMCSFDMHDLSERTREKISMKLLGKNDIDYIKGFKSYAEINIDNKRFYATHGSPMNNLNGYLFATEAEMLYKKREFMEKYDFILVGHTHFMMMYRNKIINPGSAGQPRDNNYMPSYLLYDSRDNSFLFKRFNYNYENTLKKLKNLLDDDTYNKIKRFYSP